ncbi:MAG: hypothetical protein PHO23_01040 [Candidatus Pacebacteria bacterium]|nr:hypothetical protein [Candidatus Paceibacterota bacterium]
MDFQEFKITINGQDLVVKKSCLAGQTNSSLLIQMGETELLSVAVMGKDDKLDCDFMPLTVEYTEKYYAAGKIYGSRFIRREGRPTDNAILTGRLIDRTLRPLFNDKLRREINLILTCLAIDESNDPDFLGIIGASLALGTSDIP